MKLTDLAPQFIRRLDDDRSEYVRCIDEADGLVFLCPLCFVENHRERAGVHSVKCWAPSVPQTTFPRPGRWSMQGTGYGDLTLVANSSSVWLMSGCRAHFFIEHGEIRMC